MCDDEDIDSKKNIYDSSEEIGDIDSRLIDYFLDTMEKEASTKLQLYYLRVSYPVLKHP